MAGVPLRTPAIPRARPAGSAARTGRARVRVGPVPRRRETAARGAGALLVLLAAVCGVLLAITPSVADAESRASALIAQHTDGTGSPTGPAGLAAPRFTAALIASEDARFYTHHGIDTLGVLRAAAATLGGGQTDAGGATLDQQLVKQLYFNGVGGGPWVTTQQVVAGAKLDAQFSKAQILAMYAQVVYYGHGFYGLDAATRGYFGVAPDQLSWGQAAMLSGLVQAPSADDPITHPDRARAREQHVLARLVDTGQLTPAQAGDAAAAPLQLSRPPPR